MPELAYDLLCGGEAARKSSQPGISIEATARLSFPTCDYLSWRVTGFFEDLTQLRGQPRKDRKASHLPGSPSRPSSSTAVATERSAIPGRSQPA